VLIGAVVPRLVVVIAAADVTGAVGELSGVLVTIVDSTADIKQERNSCKDICRNTI
jgi:hypothetical protein